MKYLNEGDLPFLRKEGWEVGMSGTSWFRRDKHGQEWQAFIDDADNLMFTNNQVTTDYMTRERYDEFFSK